LSSTKVTDGYVGIVIKFVIKVFCGEGHQRKLLKKRNVLNRRPRKLHRQRY